MTSRPAQIPISEKPQLPVTTVIGLIILMAAATTYSAFGLSAYPRQEWLLELLMTIVFIIPVFGVLRGPGTRSSAVRLVGLALILHSAWDALHWPGHSLVLTPIDPRIPRYCPFIDLPVGFFLFLRGK